MGGSPGWHGRPYFDGAGFGLPPCEIRTTTMLMRLRPTWLGRRFWMSALRDWKRNRWQCDPGFGYASCARGGAHRCHRDPGFGCSSCAHGRAHRCPASQNLDRRVAKLEERSDAKTVQDLDGRFTKLKEHTDATTTQIAATQKQALEENERIAAQVVGLKRDLTALTDQQQNLTGLSDQLSLIKQTIDGASIREQDIKNSIETVNSLVLDAQARADELSPRLLLEEKARKDLGNLISLFVKRLKKVNAKATELALRLSDLECRFRLKATQIEERHILERTASPYPNTIENPAKEAAPKVADGADQLPQTATAKMVGCSNGRPQAKNRPTI